MYSSTFGCGVMRNCSASRPLDHSFGYFFRLDRVFQQERSAAEFGLLQHAGLHAQRAQRGNLDALIAVGDAEPFRQARARHVW